MTDSIAFCTESIAAWSCTIEITVILFAATAHAIVSRARWGIQDGGGVAQVVDGDVEQLGGVGAGEDLVLEAHGHQVVQLRAPTRSQPSTAGAGGGRAHLVHAGGAEAHDGGVGELVEDLPRRGGAVQLLRLEQLRDEVRREHRPHHILEDCTQR